MKKLKYVKSLVIASLVVSLASVLFGIYQLINNEYHVWFQHFFLAVLLWVGMIVKPYLTKKKS